METGACELGRAGATYNIIHNMVVRVDEGRERSKIGGKDRINCLPCLAKLEGKKWEDFSYG